MCNKAEGVHRGFGATLLLNRCGDAHEHLGPGKLSLETGRSGNLYAIAGERDTQEFEAALPCAGMLSMMLFMAGMLSDQVP